MMQCATQQTLTAALLPANKKTQTFQERFVIAYEKAPFRLLVPVGGRTINKSAVVPQR